MKYFRKISVIIKKNCSPVQYLKGLKVDNKINNALKFFFLFFMWVNVLANKLTFWLCRHTKIFSPKINFTVQNALKKTFGLLFTVYNWTFIMFATFVPCYLNLKGLQNLSKNTQKWQFCWKYAAKNFLLTLNFICCFHHQI